MAKTIPEAPPRAPGQTHCRSCGTPLQETEGMVCSICLQRRSKLAGPWDLVMNWEDGYEGLRLASGAPIPWKDRNVAMIRVATSGRIEAAHTVTYKRRMLEDASKADLLLVAWPGARRQDVFVVDDRRAVARALK